MSTGPKGLTFHHAAMSLPDLERGIEWYGRVLGFSVESRFPIATADAEVAMLVRDDMRIELFQVANAAPLPGDRRSPHGDLMTHGNKHVAFQVPDVEALLTHFDTEDIDVAMVVREEFGTACFIRDCAGNLIELVQQ